ncbi:hypothetical protein GCM10017744_003040 [Streptomyces antimycoticus]|uniref:Uncharacterized protein n=1 Tax=Streptomyces antimycoticus TaxID=68175 RepID=A0A4D4KQP6_9ACTN|nr:hypothetical protein SANT12839_096600 [Streptomyces antimycoticus]
MAKSADGAVRGPAAGHDAVGRVGRAHRGAVVGPVASGRASVTGPALPRPVEAEVERYVDDARSKPARTGVRW